jgi:hypothetical protein
MGVDGARAHCARPVISVASQMLRRAWPVPKPIFGKRLRLHLVREEREAQQGPEDARGGRCWRTSRLEWSVSWGWNEPAKSIDDAFQSDELPGNEYRSREPKELFSTPTEPPSTDQVLRGASRVASRLAGGDFESDRNHGPRGLEREQAKGTELGIKTGHPVNS